MCFHSEDMEVKACLLGDWHLRLLHLVLGN